LLIAIASSAPVDNNVEVVRNEYKLLPDNGYHFGYELSDGQVREENGSIGENGDLQVDGWFTYFEDGKEYRVDYNADSNGYRAYGTHLPSSEPVIISEVAYISPALIASLVG